MKSRGFDGRLEDESLFNVSRLGISFELPFSYARSDSFLLTLLNPCSIAQKSCDYGAKKQSYGKSLDHDIFMHGHTT